MHTPIILSGHIQDTLAGQLLVATSQIGEGLFKQAVVYICSHDKQGAMGILVNKPMENITINDVFQQLQMNLRIGDRKLPLMFGGPVGGHRGFVIHSGAYQQETAVYAADGITVSANANVLHGWLEGEFAAKVMLALGYAGWMPGQLEAEIEAGGWVSVPATQALLFDTPDELKWDVANSQLGFDISKLYMTAGHA